MGWDAEGVLAGRYRNLGRIGQGGMGPVWRAHDIDLNREVAIKELQVPEQVTEQERHVWYARVEREARAAARLRHPGIVTVHDRVMGEDGRPWIVMELIHGQSLDHVLAERKALPVQQVAAIGLAMLDALSAAHAQGVVHRDVKPANPVRGAGGPPAVPAEGDRHGGNTVREHGQAGTDLGRQTRWCPLPLDQAAHGCRDSRDALTSRDTLNLRGDPCPGKSRSPTSTPRGSVS